MLQKERQDYLAREAHREEKMEQWQRERQEEHRLFVMKAATKGQHRVRAAALAKAHYDALSQKVASPILPYCQAASPVPQA